jgi:hypothetical protein
MLASVAYSTLSLVQASLSPQHAGQYPSSLFIMQCSRQADEIPCTLMDSCFIHSWPMAAMAWLQLQYSRLRGEVQYVQQIAFHKMLQIFLINTELTH